MKLRLTFLGLLAAACSVWLAGSRSRATPAFARRHGYSCSVCHQPFPRLRDEGRRFASNAFAPPDAPLPDGTFRDVGDERLSLLQQLPLALRTDLAFELYTDTEQNAFNAFKMPFELKLLSGGRLAENIGYQIEIALGDTGNPPDIRSAYIHFNDLFGTPLDLLVGQFLVSRVLFRRDLRLTLQDYAVYAARPGHSLTTLGYDRGVMLSAEFDCKLGVAAVVVNGNGTGGDSGRDFDIDSYKHYLVRLSQQLGPVRLGVFGYYGKEEQELDGNLRNNELNMWGPDLSLSLGQTVLNVQYLQRRDLNPVFNPANDRRFSLTHGFLVEGIVDLIPDPGVLYSVLMFNYVDSDVAGLSHESYTASITWLLHTNIKLLAEYTFSRFVDGIEGNRHRFILGLTAGI
jgi:hypothetical protein